MRTFSNGVAIVGMDAFRIHGTYDEYNWRCRRLACNGTRLGAVDFLERFLGVRRYTNRNYPLWTFAPARKSFTLAPCAYRDHPRFWTRWPAGENWRGGTSTDFFGGESPSPFKLAKDHPDRIEELFYRDPEGRLWQDGGEYGKNFFDITNPAFVDVLVDDFRRHYETHGANSFFDAMWAPSSRYLWFGQCDKGMTLETPRAKALPRKHPATCSTMSEVYGDFYSRLAGRLDQVLPGKTVVLLAYSNYLLPPDGISRFPDNVQILACHGTPALIGNARYRDLVTRFYDSWNSRCAPGRKCVPYTYGLSASSTTIVPALMHGWYYGAFLKAVGPHTAPHLVYSCVSRGMKKDEFPNILTCHQLFRALWNPECDPEAQMEDFFRHACGERSGEHLMRLFRILVDRWERDYLPGLERGHVFRLSMTPMQSFRSIPYTELPRLNVTTLTAPVLDALERELDAAEAALPADDPDCRSRFDLFAKPFRKAVETTRAYQRTAKAGSFEIGREKAELPPLGRYKLAGGISGSKDKAWMRWDEKGLSLSFLSRHSSFETDKPLDECARVEMLLAPGKNPVESFRLLCGANGEYEDWRRQIDPPREPDKAFAARGVAVGSKVDEKSRQWTLEVFVPWNALDAPPPKPGDEWKFNLVSKRGSSWRTEEYSLTPTLGDVWREDFYATMTFR